MFFLHPNPLCSSPVSRSRGGKVPGFHSTGAPKALALVTALLVSLH